MVPEVDPSRARHGIRRSHVRHWHDTRRATSTDNGTSFTYQARNILGDDGVGTEFPVTGLFDPTVVRLPKGHYRMYVTAQVDANRQALVRATTR